MIATTFVFAVQDGISRYLAGEYNVLMVVMIRYWFFAAFVIALASRSRGGIARRHGRSSPGFRRGAAFCWRWKSASWCWPSRCWAWWKATRSSPATRC
jgi:hypothetical protein